MGTLLCIIGGGLIGYVLQVSGLGFDYVLLGILGAVCLVIGGAL
jgi:hypothetical protein